MGCSSSKPSAPKRPSATNHRMSTKEVDSRIDSINETCVKTFGGVSVRYAYLSQRGYYPDEPHKANQDSYSITQNFIGRDSDAFFGVYDGHGRDGDKCAKFVRDKLPPLTAAIVSKQLNNEIKNANKLGNNDAGLMKSVELQKDVLQSALTKAHLECNKQMHSCRDLDDSLSGTTSISVYLHGNRNKITVSNVGDSRAVIGRSTDTSVKKEGPSSTSTLKAFALSRDQTPYRRDERIRCRKSGARVLSLDQIEGLEPINDDEDEEGNGEGDMVLGEEIDEGGDPPRIWSPHGDYPGTAFTRSIGDAIAEELGVYAEPEMLSRELTKEDKIIVLASDGVFEFLTNQSVIDICAKFTDPLEACRAVVAESYELWLQYEMRTDDITMICIFIDDVGTPMASTRDLGAISSVGSAGSGDAADDDDLISNTARPVRSTMSVEKSRALEIAKQKMYSSVADVTQFEEKDFDLESLYTEKTDEEKASIAEAIRASVMFQNITDDQRELIYKAMEPMPVEKGQWIIKQGTVGDRFYIVDEGRFEVRIVPENQRVEDGTDGGNCVHVYEGSRENHSHPSFGELALMYSAPRAASIIAQSDGLLWALHRYAFKKVIAEQSSRMEAEKVLKKIDAFKTFSSGSIKELASSLCETKFNRGDVIINEGDVGDSIFIVLPGGSSASISASKDGSERTVDLKEGGIFGEEVLDGGQDNKYLSTVTASSKMTCWSLQKSDAKRVISASC